MEKNKGGKRDKECQGEMGWEYGILNGEMRGGRPQWRTAFNERPEEGRAQILKC